MQKTTTKALRSKAYAQSLREKRVRSEARSMLPNSMF
jgi:hypothetical protein